MVLGAIVELIVVLVQVLVIGVLAPIKWLLPKSRKDVSDEIVLVTGGGMGMGRLVALEFAKRNATVVIWDINQGTMDSVAQEIRAIGKSPVFSYVVDVSKRKQVYAAADKMKRDVGDVTILVNNAGLVNPPNLLSVPDERVQLLMDVNATAHLWTLKAFLPAMLAIDRGHIATIASSAGLFGVSGMLDYCASKFAAVGLHEALELELATLGKRGIKTTLVCPYLVTTGMFQGAGIRFNWVIPKLTPEYAASRIVDGIRTNSKLVVMPRVVYAFIYLKAIMPVESMFLVAEYFGILRIMNRFAGREGEKKE